MLVGSIFSLVTAYIFGEFAALPQETSWRLWGLMGYTVIVGNIIAYTGYGRLLKRQSVTLVSLSGLLIPLFAHLYGPILTGEPISPYFFAALACVGSGLWLFNQRSLKSEQ